MAEEEVVTAEKISDAEENLPDLGHKSLGSFD